VRLLVVSIHDVAPSTLDESETWRALVADVVAGPVSLLLVPRYDGRDSWRAGAARAWAHGRAEAGDELVLHGYSHLSPGGRHGAELAGRPGRQVRASIVEGLAELRAAGLAPAGFIAPAYAHPAAAHAACRAAGLGWWATRAALHWEGGRRPLPSLGLGASTELRRALSPTFARAAARLLAQAGVIRLDLHPADLRYRAMARAGRELLERLLDQGRRPVTHGDSRAPRPSRSAAAVAASTSPSGAGTPAGPRS
jgi:predicted deacetylase